MLSVGLHQGFVVTVIVGFGLQRCLPTTGGRFDPGQGSRTGPSPGCHGYGRTVTSLFGHTVNGLYGQLTVRQEGCLLYGITGYGYVAVVDGYRTTIDDGPDVQSSPGQDVQDNTGISYVRTGCMAAGARHQVVVRCQVGTGQVRCTTMYKPQYARQIQYNTSTSSKQQSCNTSRHKLSVRVKVRYGHDRYGWVGRLGQGQGHVHEVKYGRPGTGQLLYRCRLCRARQVRWISTVVCTVRGSGRAGYGCARASGYDGRYRRVQRAVVGLRATMMSVR